MATETTGKALEALTAAGKGTEASGVLATARDQLLPRAAKISDTTWRERFLTQVPDNARTLALARAWAALGASNTPTRSAPTAMSLPTVGF